MTNKSFRLYILIYFIALEAIEVEGGDSCGISEKDETPQEKSCASNSAQLFSEEAWRSPAESVRLKRKLPILFQSQH